MAEAPIIRPATPADAAEIARLAGQLGYPCTPKQMEARLADVLATAGHRVLVAQGPDGAIVGWLHVGCLKWLEGDPRAEIGGLVVDEARRGEKIGERLVEAAIRWAEGKGYSEVRVRSNVARADAHRFYERLGFVRVKVQQVFRRSLGR